MNGRTEHKIKTEQKIIKQINDSGYELIGFYNYISSKYEHKTKELYITYIIKFLKCINKNINEITSEDLSEYLNNLTYKQNNDGCLEETSGTYRAVVHSALKLYFHFLYETKIITINPMLYVPRPRNKKDSLIERVYLEPNELQIMVNNIQNDTSNVIWKNRDILILMVFLYTGIRCTALTEINIEDINIKDKTLSIIDKRNKRRLFKIDDEMIEVYLKVVNQNNQFKAKTNALFISNRYDRISARTVSRVIEKYSCNLGKHITPHKLRRSFGTNLYNQTGDIYAVQNALGHEDIRTTQIYVKANCTEAAEKGMIAMKNQIKF